MAGWRRETISSAATWYVLHCFFNALISKALISEASAFAKNSPLVGNELEEIRDFLLTCPQFCLPPPPPSVFCFGGCFWFGLFFLNRVTAMQTSFLHCHLRPQVSCWKMLFLLITLVFFFNLLKTFQGKMSVSKLFSSLPWCVVF